ncbi:AraC family transcriptional regulator [Flavobacterium sp. AC]|uniref:AraC family transcriptional regulator n=2 Tax=Flavobacterium azizsancarii TaxID=2961580 RepID=A0ABT4WG30_9FLAO|nr:AraC family transcriptional regulator [Flavobacterium azizsancarii]
MQFKYNKLLNIYLLLSFKLLALNFLFIGLDGFDILRLSQKGHYPYYPFLIVIIPAMYLYFVNIDKDSKKFNYKELTHFILPIFLVLLNLAAKRFLIVMIPPFWIKLFFSIMFEAYIIYYNTISYSFLKNKIWNREPDLINIKQNRILKQWSFFIFYLYCLIVFHLIVVITMNLKSPNNSELNSYKFFPALLLNILYFKILFTPEILYGYNVMHDKIKQHNKSTFILKDLWILDSSDEISNVQDRALSKKIAEYTSSYIHDIEKLVFKYEIFRNPNASINDIANKLKIPKSHLTFVFKYVSKVSFTEFKKIVRIHDALQLIEKDYLKSNTIESLASKVGFSSYSPFYTTFKEVTGISPQVYIKKKVK